MHGSNEVYNVSVQQLILEIRAVKVERSKKKPDLNRFFFDRSTLTARISRTSCCTETLYTSFESLILSFYELEGQGAWLPHMTATHS